jgi:hypothetical protein
MDTPPGLKCQAFSFGAGEDYSFPIALEPPASVVGQIYQFAAFGSSVSFAFPPTTTLPTGYPYGPIVPFAPFGVGSLGVTPGILPDLPSSGGTTTLNLDNSTHGGVTVDDPDVGLFTVTFAASLTRSVSPQSFVWYFRRVDSGHNVVCKWGGFDILPSPSALI